MIARIKAIISKVAARHDVQSAARHAATAFGAVIIAAVTVGGIHAVTTVVVIAAAGAALRVIELAIVAKISRRKVKAAA